MDIWVRATAANAGRVWEALVKFGAPLTDLSEDELADPGLVFQMGVPPCRIDLLTSVSGAEFGPAWEERIEIDIGDLTIPVIGRRTLIENKRAAGRPKDLVDIEALEAADADA